MNVVTMRQQKLDRINKVDRLPVDFVTVKANQLRPVDDEKVKLIAASMARIGLMTPITVRFRPDDTTPDEGDYELIAGRHRLAAAKLLGWDSIDVIELIRCSDVDAKLWEIAENLHRAELTKLQRDEQVALWIALTDGVSAQPAQKPKGGRPEGGLSAAARELGVDRDDARRAVKVASLSDAAKAAAVKHGLDDNRSALLAAARSTAPEDQVAKIVEIAVNKTKTAPLAEASKEDEEEEAPNLYVETDMPGAKATNGLITSVMGFFERLDPAFTKWLNSNPTEEAADALFNAIYEHANDLRRRAYDPINKKRKEHNKIFRAYIKRFGFVSGLNDVVDDIERMSGALASGVDDPVFVAQRVADKAESEEWRIELEERHRKHEEFLATPINSETEAHYTAMIKQRTLYEGACELSWPMYFKYLDEHPELDPLTPDDLEYAGMWTSCAVRI
jgi:ParB-like nuclease domain